MVISARAAALRDALPNLTLTKPTPANSADSFTQQLASTIQNYLQNSGTKGGFEIDIQPGQSQNSGDSQFVVTVKNLSSGASRSLPAAAPAPAATPAPAAAPANVTAKPPAAATASAATLASPAAPSTSSSNPPGPTPAGTGSSMLPPTAPFTPATPAPDTSDMVTLQGPSGPLQVKANGKTAGTGAPYIKPADVYWAEQPAAVQALRDMPDDARATAAQALAAKGYKIDVPIMVWGWDPLVTMTVRQNMGYTWVPSGGQSPVPVTPGISFAGLPSYDPNSPPQGSIKVTTDFAKLATAPGPYQNILSQG